MKLAALCCTYLRPHTLGLLIESFLRQDYPRELRELVILDDAGQYDHQEGEGWRLISIPKRFNTLGEKRNACAALASRDAEAFLVADDDDIYLPHWFSSHAECLTAAEWSRPSLVLSESGHCLKTHETHGLYHASWAFRREAFYRVRGYRPCNNGEDQDLANRFVTHGISSMDPCQKRSPFFICREDTGSYHLSYMADDGYDRLGVERLSRVFRLQIGWPRDYSALPVTSRE